MSLTLLQGGSIAGGRTLAKGNPSGTFRLLQGGGALPAGMSAMEYEFRVEELLETAEAIGDPGLTRSLWDTYRPGARLRMVKG